MALWKKVDGADVADTVVNVTTTSGSKTLTTASTTDIKEFDQISGTGIPAGSTVAHVIGATSFTISKAATASATVSGTFVHKNANKPKFQTVAEQKQTYAVDPNEARIKPVTHSGWVRVTEGSGGRTGRKLYETIIAMGSITTDAEDTAFPDPTITISAQPTATTIRLASGVNVGSPVTFGATVSVTGRGLVPTYQWKVSDTSAGSYTNVVNGAGISGALTNTLLLTTKAVNSKFYKLAISVVTPIGGPLTALSNAAKVVGTQVTESITWISGFVTVTTVAPHGFSNSDSIVMAGFTPSGYNGTFTIANASGSSFTFPLTTDPGAATIQGTATKSIEKITQSLTWLVDVATVTTTTAHGFTNGDSIVIAGVTPAAYNGTYTISNASGSVFDYALVVADPGAASVQGTATKNIVATGSDSVWTSNVATVTAAVHGLVPTDQVVVLGVTSSGYNGTQTVATSDANTFTYAIATAESAASVQGEIYKVVA